VFKSLLKNVFSSHSAWLNQIYKYILHRVENKKVGQSSEEKKQILIGIVIFVVMVIIIKWLENTIIWDQRNIKETSTSQTIFWNEKMKSLMMIFWNQKATIECTTFSEGTFPGMSNAFIIFVLVRIISAGLPLGNESSNFYCYQVVYRIKIVPINLPTDNFYDKTAVFDKISDNRHTDRPYKTPLYFIMSICITCYSIIRDESFVIETWQKHTVQ